MRKDIIFIFPYNKVSGMEKRYIRLANNLQKEGNHNVKYFITKVGYLNASNAGIQIDIRKCEFLPWSFYKSLLGRFIRFLGTIWLLLKLSLLNNTSHVICATNPSRLVNWLIKIRHILPKISCLSVNNNCSSWYRSKKMFTNLKYLHSIDCLSPMIKEIMDTKAASMGFKYFNLKVAPCSFIDNETYQDSKQDNRDIDILMVGRLIDPQKGLSLLRNCIEDLDSLNIHLVTPEPHKLDITKKNVSIYYSNAPMNIYKNSKIFLSLQQHDNYPSQSLLEAAMSECAVISTDVGSTRLLLDEGNSVLINYDSNVLSYSIQKLINNSDLRMKLARELKLKVLKEHTIQRYSKYFLDHVCN